MLRQAIPPSRPPSRAADLPRRYLKFCLVGGIGVLVDMAVLYALYSPAGLGWNLSLSKALAAETALVNNFLWNEVWTFRGLATRPRGPRHRLARFVRFNLVCLVGIGWNMLLINLFARRLDWNVYLANLLAIGLVSLWNFGLSLRWGWRVPAAPRPASPVQGEDPVVGTTGRTRCDGRRRSR